MILIKEKYLVVNADDLGIDARINEGIAECCRYGIVRSVSIIAIGKAFEQGLSLIKGVPGVGIGVHLCLVAEKPALPAGMIPSLIDGEGNLSAIFSEFIFKLWTGRINLREVERELDAQIKKVLDKGIIPTHLDSHQYIHLIPQVLEIVLRLAVKYDIRWIRYPAFVKNGSYSDLRSFTKKFWLAVVSNSQKRRMSESSVLFPDYSYGVNNGGHLDKSLVMAYLQTLGEGLSDLTSHPGYLPEDIQYVRWRYNWQKELKALIDPEVVRLIAREGIMLGNYALKGLLK